MKTWSSTASATLVQKRRGLWIKWSELYAQMLVYFFPDVSLSIAWEGWLGSLLKPWDECCTSSLSVFGFQCLLPFFKKGVHNVSYTFQWAGRTHAKQEQNNWRQSPPLLFYFTHCIHLLLVLTGYDLSVISPTFSLFLISTIWEVGTKVNRHDSLIFHPLKGPSNSSDNQQVVFSVQCYPHCMVITALYVVSGSTVCAHQSILQPISWLVNPFGGNV